MLKTIFIAATALTLSSVAQADTVKQIWNQEIGEGNPGRVESAGDCTKDDSSNFGCWNDRDDFDADTDGAASPVDTTPTDETDQPPVN